MSADKHKQDKQNLLAELEQLRKQLDDPHGEPVDEEQIPLLLDRVDQVVGDEQSRSSETEEEQVRAAYEQETGDLDDPEERLVADAIQRLKHDRDIVDRALDQDAAHNRPDVIEGQQGLFEAQPTEDAEAPVPPTPPRPRARGDNPFLPQHIRERLQERRQALANDIAQAASYFPANPAPSRSHAVEPAPRKVSQDEDQALVDELVAEYLPRIEAELRRRLMQRLARQQDEDPAP